MSYGTRRRKRWQPDPDSILKKKGLLHLETPDTIQRMRLIKMKTERNPEYEFMEAIRTRNIEEIRRLMSIGGCPVRNYDFLGRSPMVESAKTGNIEIVKIFVEASLNKDIQDRYGKTALMEAAKLGYYHIAKYLLEQGASVNIRDRRGNGAHTCAIDNHHEDIAKMIQEYSQEGSVWMNQYDTK